MRYKININASKGLFHLALISVTHTKKEHKKKRKKIECLDKRFVYQPSFIRTYVCLELIYAIQWRKSNNKKTKEKENIIYVHFSLSTFVLYYCIERRCNIIFAKRKTINKSLSCFRLLHFIQSKCCLLLFGLSPTISTISKFDLKIFHLSSVSWTQKRQN